MFTGITQNIQKGIIHTLFAQYVNLRGSRNEAKALFMLGRTHLSKSFITQDIKAMGCRLFIHITCCFLARGKMHDVFQICGTMLSLRDILKMAHKIIYNCCAQCFRICGLTKSGPVDLLTLHFLSVHRTSFSCISIISSFFPQCIRTVLSSHYFSLV